MKSAVVVFCDTDGWHVGVFKRDSEYRSRAYPTRKAVVAALHTELAGKGPFESNVLLMTSSGTVIAIGPVARSMGR